ncbi:MAG: HAD family hydrolase [Leptolyngbya sp. Prado105]|nr:HAD family hydrolase [Leptolyngbya sp. Prado105]
MATIICNGKQFNHIAAVLFDKDGTLSNSQQFLHDLGQKRADCVEAIVPNLKSSILKTFGFQQNYLNPSGLLAVGTREENEIAIATLITEKGYDWIEAKTIVQSSFQLAAQQLPRKATLAPVFEGITELLDSLTPLKLGILSSDSTENILDFVDHYKLSRYFQAIIGAQPGISKPNPALLSLACRSLSVEPQSALMIGDTLADMRLTPLAIGVTWGGSTIAHLSEAAAIAHHPIDIQLSST